jgi:hypothetical protein
MYACDEMLGEGKRMERGEVELLNWFCWELIFVKISN